MSSGGLPAEPIWGDSKSEVNLPPGLAGANFMDRITESLLEEFSNNQNLLALPEDKRFEHFAAYITVRRHLGQIFDTAEVVVGSGGDTGIDAIAIIVNGTLVTDIDGFEEQAEDADYLDVQFVFVQAERSSGFDAAKMGTFEFGVQDFFRDAPMLPRNEAVTNAATLMSAIYKRSGLFKRGNPSCRMYYVTTGKWQGDPVLEARRQNAIAQLQATGLFGEVEFTCLGADGAQKLYNQTKNAITREFTFSSRIEAPEIPGISEAYIGYVPFSQFLPLVSDEEGEMLRTIFYDNVRDWQDYNPVNSDIRGTLQSDHAARFVLMNNGVTIIARGVRRTASKFHIEDYQIVNGCQTSNVIFDQRATLNDSVQIPLRLICTQDEEVIESIIKSTNRQTEVKPEQFAAITDFAKKLEAFFGTFPLQHRLYYERRTGQYDRESFERTRIVQLPTMVRSFAAMFLGEPHRTTRSYKLLKGRVGTDIYGPAHRLEPYYAAAYASYRLEVLFRTQKLEAKYKPARFHILLASRMLINPSPLPAMKSNEMEKRAKEIIDALSDPAKGDDLLAQAAEMVDAIADGNFHRDNIRTQTFTEQLVKTVALALGQDSK